MTCDNARVLAHSSLKKCTKGGKYSNLEVLSSLSRTSLDTRDKALYTALVYGVIERTITLDAIISEYSDIVFERIDCDTLIALRMGVYQILYMDRIPDFSACDESVKLVSKKSKPFVNAVLRSIVKNKAEVIRNIEMSPLDVKYSMPDWIIDIWQKGYGEEKCLEILRGFDKKPDVTLRVNTLKITSDNLVKRFTDSGITAIQHPRCPDVITVDTGNIEMLYGFAEGLFFVQGTNSRLAVSALGLSEGMTVIDTCACPGGKSFTAAIDMKNKGTIYSFDLHANKLSLIDKGAQRLGIDIIKISQQNAITPDERLFGVADAVICDVPCSGLGIIGKKPDIKYKALADIQRLSDIQYCILTESSKYLKKGGKLLYSTCTLNPCENEDITDKFLSVNKEFHRALPFAVTAFPNELSEDGFFYDVLIKD